MSAAGPNEAAAVAPVQHPMAATAARPWGVWTTLALYLLIFEVEPWIYDRLEAAAGLDHLAAQHPVLNAVNLFAAHAVRLLLFVVAVRMTGVPLRQYFGWTRPRLSDVVLGVAIIVGLYSAVALLMVLGGGAAGMTAEYRQALAAGMSPWWYVLRWWPAIFLAPIVEEVAYRGFVWYGVQYRLGNWAAFLITILLFAGAHYQYWAPGGQIDPGSVVQYVVVSAIFGWLRWRSGNTVVSTIAHVVDNGILRIMVIVVSTFA